MPSMGVTASCTHETSIPAETQNGPSRRRPLPLSPLGTSASGGPCDSLRQMQSPHPCLQVFCWDTCPHWCHLFGLSLLSLQTGAPQWWPRSCFSLCPSAGYHSLDSVIVAECRPRGDTGQQKSTPKHEEQGDCY